MLDLKARVVKLEVLLADMEGPDFGDKLAELGALFDKEHHDLLDARVSQLEYNCKLIRVDLELLNVAPCK